MMKTLFAVGLLSLAAVHASGQTLSEAQIVVDKEILPMAEKMVEAKKAKVEDIGGLFIYSNDPKTLADWYKDKMGIELAYNAEEKNYYCVFVRSKDNFGANTVFAIKQAGSMLSSERNQFTVNFRVDDFDGIIERLKTKGVVIDRTQDYPGFGRFGWIKDLEGNLIEFWQPKK